MSGGFGLEGAVTGLADDGCRGQGGGGNPDGAAARAGCGDQVAVAPGCAAGAVGGVVFVVAPQGDRGFQRENLIGVAGGGFGGEGCGRPAGLVVVLDSDAELFGVGLVLAVVVAALAAGVLDAACRGQGVDGFVEHGGQNRLGASAEPFVADHDFGALFACDVPPAGGVVAEAGLFAFGAAGDDDDDPGDFRVAAADLQPDVFQDLEYPAGRLPVAVGRPSSGLGPVARAGVLPPGADRASGAGAVQAVVAAAAVGVGEGVVGFGEFPELAR